MVWYSNLLGCDRELVGKDCKEVEHEGEKSKMYKCFSVCLETARNIIFYVCFFKKRCVCDTNLCNGGNLVRRGISFTILMALTFAKLMWLPRLWLHIFCENISSVTSSVWLFFWRTGKQYFWKQSRGRNSLLAFHRSKMNLPLFLLVLVALSGRGYSNNQFEIIKQVLFPFVNFPHNFGQDLQRDSPATWGTGSQRPM